MVKLSSMVRLMGYCLMLPLALGATSVAYAVDERPVDELMLMNQADLAQEARRTCSISVLLTKHSDQWARHRRYLERLQLVVRKKHNGEMPS